MQASGFVVGNGTELVTNLHVIEGAESIRCTFQDGVVLQAVGVLAIDRDADLALLKLSGEKRPSLVVQEGVLVEVGGPVMSVGNPQGVGLTFADGMVSAIRVVDGVQHVQHTAPISPGNSGGPLLDPQGRLVGVNSWLNGRMHSQNLNFAVATPYVSSLMMKAAPLLASDTSMPLSQFAAPPVPTPAPLQPACSPPEWTIGLDGAWDSMEVIVPDSRGWSCRHLKRGARHLVAAIFADHGAPYTATLGVGEQLMEMTPVVRSLEYAHECGVQLIRGDPNAALYASDICLYPTSVEIARYNGRLLISYTVNVAGAFASKTDWASLCAEAYQAKEATFRSQ